MEQKHPGGRPPFFNTPEEMENLIDEYINTESRLTVTGLAIALGFASRQSIYDYLNAKPEFSYLLTRAILHVENCYEKNLYEKASNGAQFALQNMGWKTNKSVDFHGHLKTEQLKPVTLDDIESQITDEEPRDA